MFVATPEELKQLSELVSVCQSICQARMASVEKPSPRFDGAWAAWAASIQMGAPPVGTPEWVAVVEAAKSVNPTDVGMDVS